MSNNNKYKFEDMVPGAPYYYIGETCTTRTPVYAALRKFMERNPGTHFRASRAPGGWIRIIRCR